MVDFGNAIKKPFSDKKTMLIGLILGAIPVVNLLIGGYALKVAEDTIKGNTAIRKWVVGDIVEYITKLIMSVIISIVYLIIPLIIIVIGIGTAAVNLLPALTTGTIDPTVFMTALGAGGAIVLVGVILAVLVSLALPMAIMKWLKAGSMGAAFKIGDVVKSCLTGDYIITWIVVIIYSVILTAILGLIAGLLGMIPYIGIVLSMLVLGLLTFSLSVTEYSMFAQTVK